MSGSDPPVDFSQRVDASQRLDVSQRLDASQGLDVGQGVGHGPPPGALTHNVRPSRPGEAAAPDQPPPDLTGGARPLLWLGAEAPGGLMLPAAHPTASQLYAPRSVWIHPGAVIAADTGNHRVLIWHGDSEELGSHRPADVVLGQPDFFTEGAQAGGRGPERGMRLPTGVTVIDGRLVVADAWNHRVLIWDEIPQVSDRAPDLILGQRSADEVTENRGQGCGPTGFYWPFGVAQVDGVFYIADTGNRRVLGWSDGLPLDPELKPDIVLGQPDSETREENRGQLGPDSFRWPHAVAGSAQSSKVVWVADAGNHRLLGWLGGPGRDRPADLVLGQPDFVTGSEFPYAPQTATGFRFPYAVTIDGAMMAVADTANNRVLLWDSMPTESGVAADRVLGQPTFAVNGENRWDVVAPDSLCWPYGIHLSDGRLAVADSGNNRILLWDLRPEARV